MSDKEAEDARFRLYAGTDPFAAPLDERDPPRRFRGRLPAPVTVWTAGTQEGDRAGLTVSSLLVIEGSPASALGVVGPLSEVWDVIRDTKRFVVHALAHDQRRIADDFAGRVPGPDAPFNDLELEWTEWGPALAAVPTRAYCSFDGYMEVGYFLLIRGSIDKVDLPDDAPSPLAFARGNYRAISSD